MNLEQWDAWLERIILGLVGAALGVGILAFGGVRVREFVVVEALVALAALVWVVRLWSVREHRLLWPPLCWGVLLFAGWAVWRTWEADLPYVALGELLRILTYTTLFLVVVNNLHRQDTAQGLAWFLTALATLLCYYGAWQFASSSNTVWGLGRSEDYVHRASGSYANPNHFAGLMELLLPLVITSLIAGRVKPLGRVLLAYAALVLLAGLALTFSRGGWVAAAAGIGLVLLTLARNRDYRWPALVCLALLLLGGAAMATRSSIMQQRLETSHDLNPQARNSRPNIWRAAFAMWRDHPWFGVGPAHFNERFEQYRTHWVHGDPERAHNDYVDALADWGVAGTAVIAVPWLLFAYGISRTLRQVRRDPSSIEVKRSGRYAFVLGASGGLVALLVHSLTDFNFHIPGNALVAVTWIGLVAGYSRYATDDWWVSSRVPWRLPCSLLLLALAGALGWDCATRGREQRHLVRADRLPAGSETRLAELTAAWNLRPGNAWTAYHIGELYRLRSFTGTTEYADYATNALAWFDRAHATHPYEPAFLIRAGMTLDWIQRPTEAAGRFQQAHKIDPEGRITTFHLGWHELQQGDEVAARKWFIKSLEQGWPVYEPAVTSHRILEDRTRAQTGPTAPAPAAPAAPAAP